MTVTGVTSESQAIDPGEGGVSRRVRVANGMRRSENWLQLVRFVVVGGSGFVINLAIFAISVHLLGLPNTIGAFLGFLGGVANNFFWHRHWTFGANDGHAGFQAARFLIVYGVTFVIGVGILQAMVAAGSAELIGQAVSQILITPLNFLGHKLWSFGDR